MKRSLLRLLVVLWACAALATPVHAQMPNPKEMSGRLLPVNDLPAGTITVRVIRGTLDKNIAGQTVEFTVNGQKRTAVTDASGRAQVSDLPAGARVRAVAVVDGERLESQEAVIGSTGFRIVLVATDAGAATAPPAAGGGAASAPTGPVTTGAVSIGPGARIIAELASERLTMYYSLDIVNASPGPVDIGGPLVFKLPTEARGTTLLQGSTKQAQTNGPRVTVTGPFAPGTTSVQFAYEMPYSGGSVRVHQQFPAAVEGLTVFALKVGDIDISSPQLPQKQNTTQQGQPLIVTTGPPIQADHAIDVDISGLPYHALWPRYVALTLSGLIVTLGIWAAAVAPRRRAV
jgi:hypothetical protein